VNEQNPLLDFRNFLILVWHFLGLPSPTPRQLAIAHYLQTGPRRKVIMAFRGVGKSWITAAYVVWRLYCNPQLKILVVSASKTRADNFTTFCLQLINLIPQLHHLRPREGQRCSKLMFDVGPAKPDQSPSVMSAGIGGQITGMRADEIVPDDVEVPNNSATQMMREKLAESIKEFDAILKPNGATTYLGTPQTESSIYNLLPDRGYTIRIWPVRYPDAKQRENYGDRLAPDILADLEADPTLVGKSTEPTRFTDLDLMERELSYGRAGFALQFMLDTRLSDVDRYPLKLSNLIVTPLDREIAPDKVVWANLPENVINDLPNVGIGNDRLYRAVHLPNINYSKYTGCVMAIDPSGRGKDETAYAIVAILHSQLFLLDAGGFNDGYGPETLRKLAEAAATFNVKKIIVEQNFGDGMFTQLLKPVLASIHPCAVEEVRHSQQKERRIIDTLEPVLASHRLVVDRGLLKKDYDSTQHYPAEIAQRYQLFYQLTRITRDKGSLMNDDRLDALSIAVGYFVKAMAQDVEKAVADAEAKRLDDELKRFMKHALGSKYRDLRQVWATRA